jgi:REP element-mobilizing transposase RayT
VIRSVKGRLQNLIRTQVPKAFHRNYRIDSVGSARSDVIEDYVSQQLDHHQMVDSRVDELLAKYQVAFPSVDLDTVQTSSHGQYRYNLHLVFVHCERWCEIRQERLSATRKMIIDTCRKKGHRLSRAAILADHLHLTVGCSLTQSPREVALALMNNLAYAHGMQSLYQFGFYVGTFGEYDLGAIRHALAASQRPTGTSPVEAEASGTLL